MVLTGNRTDFCDDLCAHTVLTPSKCMLGGLGTCLARIKKMAFCAFRRTIKNTVQQFTPVEVKVRDATCNDPWGPSTGQMSELADLTHDPIAFAEIMQVLWRRLNESGKQWRHVYKSLVVLEFLCKCGSEKVQDQCRLNIFTVESLADFEYAEKDTDYGRNVREKAKAFTELLHDKERLDSERARFVATQNRCRKTSSSLSLGPGIGAFEKSRRSVSPSNRSVNSSLFPQDAIEERMHLQLAMKISKEEVEREERKRAQEVKVVEAVLEESKKDSPSPNAVSTKCTPSIVVNDEAFFHAFDQVPRSPKKVQANSKPTLAVDDLLSLDFGVMQMQLNDGKVPSCGSHTLNLTTDPFASHGNQFGGATQSGTNGAPTSHFPNPFGTTQVDPFSLNVGVNGNMTRTPSPVPEIQTLGCDAFTSGYTSMSTSTGVVSGISAGHNLPYPDVDALPTGCSNLLFNNTLTENTVTEAQQSSCWERTLVQQSSEPVYENMDDLMFRPASSASGFSESSEISGNGFKAYLSASSTGGGLLDAPLYGDNGSAMGDIMPVTPSGARGRELSSSSMSTIVSAQRFLGEHRGLVDLDNLVPAPPPESKASNPFGADFATLAQASQSQGALCSSTSMPLMPMQHTGGSTRSTDSAYTLPPGSEACFWNSGPSQQSSYFAAHAQPTTPRNNPFGSYGIEQQQNLQNMNAEGQRNPFGF